MTVVATPIGNFADITLRAKDLLQNCDAVIGEEHRVTSTLLKKLGLPQKEIYLLNEHSKKQDIDELTELCRDKNIVLISDCGTPVFCDPGSVLIKKLRHEKIPVASAPGPSSLMTLLSLSSRPIKDFYFAGFPPAEAAQRKDFFTKIAQMKTSLILMDTPYRLEKVFQELEQDFKTKEVLLGLNLTQASEQILEGHLTYVKKNLPTGNHEFILLIYNSV